MDQAMVDSPFEVVRCTIQAGESILSYKIPPKYTKGPQYAYNFQMDLSQLQAQFAWVISPTLSIVILIFHKVPFFISDKYEHQIICEGSLPKV